MTRPLIGITGAEGQIGTLLRRDLSSEFAFKAFTLRPQSSPSTVLDLADAAAVQGAFEGLDTVIHLAAEPDPRAGWDSVRRNNIDVLYNVLEECVRARVRKVIFASTHHTQHGLTMRDGNPGTLDPSVKLHKDLDSRPDPDSLYAVSKLFGEDMGRLYSIRHGLRFIALRIGWVELEENPKQYLGTIHDSYLRSYFLSQRDCVEAFRAALLNPADFLVAYAISANPGCVFDVEASNQQLGFTPTDRVEDFLA